MNIKLKPLIVPEMLFILLEKLTTNSPFEKGNGTFLSVGLLMSLILTSSANCFQLLQQQNNLTSVFLPHFQTFFYYCFRFSR